MKRLTLRDLPSGCFDGVIPAVLGTCADDGTPNATWLSQVFLLDDRHIALSCQFFRKTRANLEANPRAQLLLVAPNSILQWRLDLRFLRSETQGRTFEAMKSRIEAIASVTRMEAVFALSSADVFEVDSITPIDVEQMTSRSLPDRSADRLLELSRLTEVIGSSTDLPTLVDSGLGFLASQLGYESVGIYLLEESEQALYALATHGFSTSGVGARVELGVGVIGTCAKHRIPIRIADVDRERLYGRAVQEQLERINPGG